ADEIKHVLYSTKVMGYREEVRESITTGKSRGVGGSSSHGMGWASGTGSGTSTGSGDGESFMESEDDNDAEERRRLNRSRSNGESSTSSTSESVTNSESDNWSESESHSVTHGTVLIPQMGKELSHVQFRSLEEQLFRAMAALFSQPERQAVVRLLGMRAPVTIQTLPIKSQIIRRDRINAYAAKLYA